MVVNFVIKILKVFDVFNGGCFYFVDVLGYLLGYIIFLFE